AERFERSQRTLDDVRFEEPFLALLADLARQRQIVEDLERVVGVRHFIQTGNADGDARPGFLNGPAEIVVESANAAEARAADDDVAAAQGTFLHQQGGLHALALAEHGFQAGAAGRLVRVRLQLLHLGNQREYLQQLVDALTGGGAG